VNNVEKIAIHCPTEKLFLAVLDKRNLLVWQEYYKNDRSETCVEMNEKGMQSKEYYINKGYTIIPASEYLKEGGNEVEFKGLKIPPEPESDYFLYVLKTGGCENDDSDVEVMCAGIKCEDCILSTNNMDMLREYLNKQNKEEVMTINSTIRKVFVEEEKAEFSLVEKMEENFGTEIEENFTGYLILKANKKKYIDEITRREEEKKEEEDK
jgi:hypothetical protein